MKASYGTPFGFVEATELLESYGSNQENIIIWGWNRDICNAIIYVKGYSMAKLIYHYTKEDAFNGIIESRSFRLTDLWTSMDKKEMTHVKDLIHESLEGIVSEGDIISTPAHNFYALSCTDIADDYLHYQCYADNCKGVAIGIDPNFLEAGVPNKQCVDVLAPHLYFSEIIYDEQKQRNAIESQLDALRRNGTADGFLAYELYNFYYARMKAPNFSSEREVRLIYRQDYHGTRTLSIPLDDGSRFFIDEFFTKIGLEPSFQNGSELKNIKTFCIKGNTRTGYELSLEPFGINNVIKTVTLGPKMEKSASEVKAFLRANNVYATVNKSNIALRN